MQCGKTACIASETTSMALGKKQSRTCIYSLLGACFVSYLYIFRFVFSIAANRYVCVCVRAVWVHCCTFNKRINFPEMRCIPFRCAFRLHVKHSRANYKIRDHPGPTVELEKISFRSFFFSPYYGFHLSWFGPLPIPIPIALSLSISHCRLASFHKSYSIYIFRDTCEKIRFIRLFICTAS